MEQKQRFEMMSKENKIVNKLVKENELNKKEWTKLYDMDYTRLKDVMVSFKEMIKNKKISERIEWFIKDIKLYCNKTQHPYVLDVGCFDGYTTYCLKQAGFNPTGIDCSPKAIEEADKNVPNVPFTVGFAEELPFQDELFDAVIMSQVIEHLKEPVVALKEAMRVLKPNGLLLVTTPIGKNLLDPLHVRFFDYYKSGENVEGLYELFNQITNNYKIILCKKWFKNKKPNVFYIRAFKEVNEHAK